MEKTPINLEELRHRIERLLPAKTAFLLVTAAMFEPSKPTLCTNVHEDDAFSVLRELLREKQITDAVESQNN